jgi:hypothetical protein
MNNETRIVKLPEDLCAQLQQEFGASFDSLEAILIFVMQQLTLPQAANLDKNEQQILEQRLRDLGYL